ncbi:MAG: hypothetical protein KF878_23635 [Planctomycetes bacterium]|nr:hypothetical protein [Planctomycetota bacterium]
MEGEAAERVRVERSAVRCPFCHDDVRLADADWVACAGCLARHHGACWAEAGRCGACQGAEALARTGGAPAPSVTEAPTPPLTPEALGWLVPWRGAPREVAFTRTIAGEVGDEVDEVVVTEARRRLGAQGRFERLGRTLTWTSAGTQPGERAVIVTLSSRDGATHLDVREDLRPIVLGARLIGGIFATLLPLMLVAGTKGAPLAVAGAVLVAMSFLLLARAMVARPYLRRRPELAALTDALERELAARARRRADPKAP